jgi:hypothetical protein
VALDEIEPDAVNILWASRLDASRSAKLPPARSLITLVRDTGPWSSNDPLLP